MGDVVPFRKKRLTGFLPDDLGERETMERRRLRDLVRFAKQGEPPQPDNIA